MNRNTYTAIPPTSDTDYWQISFNQETRLTTCIPKDKELHHRLKTEAWKVIQAAQARRQSRRKE